MIKLVTVLFALIGAPLFIVISALALLSFHAVDIDPAVVIIEMTRLGETPLLISLPLFIFAGTMLAESGAPERMLKLPAAARLAARRPGRHFAGAVRGIHCLYRRFRGNHFCAWRSALAGSAQRRIH